MAPVAEGCARCLAAELRLRVSRRNALPGVRQHLGRALGLPWLMGWDARDGVGGTCTHSSPLGARTVAAGLRDTVRVGQRLQTPYKPQQGRAASAVQQR